MLRTIAIAFLLTAASSVLALDFRPIVVLHGEDAPITEQYVAKVIEAMNQIAAAGPGCGDIRFFRGAMPKVSADIPFEISLRSHTTRLFGLDGGNVIVARQLSFCGHPDPGFGGCSGNKQNALVEFFPNTRQAAQLWLHEIGHSHNSPAIRHVNDDTRLMHPNIVLGRHKLVASECASYVAANSRFPIFQGEIAADVLREADLLSGDLIGSGPGAGDAPTSPVSEDQVLQLKAILAGLWAGGTAGATLLLDPLAAEMPDFLLTLRAILGDEAEIELWPNTVLALGVYGEESDIEFLDSFLRERHPTSDLTVQSLSNAPFAIGLLTGRFASQRGLGLLEQVAEIEAAAALLESAANSEASSQLAQSFAQQALIALAQAEGEISRNSQEGGGVSFQSAARAEDAFESLAARIGTDDPPFPVEKGTEAELVQMLNELRNEVARIGLEAYVRTDQF